MVRPIRKSKTIRQLRREVRATIRLSPAVLLALLLVAVFWQTDLGATAGLFQSPPTATAPLPPTVPPPETPTPEVLPTMVVTATATLTPTLEPTLLPTLEPTVTWTPSPSPTAATLPVTPTAEVSSTPEGGILGRSRYAEGDTGLSFEWGMLFDSVALGLSYTWLCCGVLVLLGIPALFFGLWVAARRRNRPLE